MLHDRALDRCQESHRTYIQYVQSTIFIRVTAFRVFAQITNLDTKKITKGRASHRPGDPSRRGHTAVRKTVKDSKEGNQKGVISKSTQGCHVCLV